MESNRSNKRKGGFAKSMMSFYGGKPIKASPPLPPATAVGFIIVKQDQVYPSQNPKVAFVVPDRNAKLDKFYGGAPVDEAVDAKATKYISGVQERFRLECKTIQDMHLF